jgi:type II secretory pathway pseudopilin PulG
MFCARCGAALAPGATFCSQCGTLVAAAAPPLAGIRRPGLVTLLAVLNFIGAALSILGAVGMLAAAVLGDRDELGPIAAILGSIFLVAGCLQLASGIGLIKLKPYGRTLQIVLAVIGLLGFPLGTIISICILVYMTRPGIKALFSGRPVNELTPIELAQIASVTSGSSATVVVVVLLVVIVGIVVLGIIAAIAVPGLLRARMSANEATAIGAMRAVMSAQAAYSSAAASGGYATSLRVLATPCPGASQGFILPDLGTDPSEKSGYRIALASAGAPAGPPDCNGRGTEENYYATATPVTHGSTGRRSFSTSAAGTIFFTPMPDPPSPRATLDGTATPVR